MPGSDHVGFVVHKEAMGQVFLRVLKFSPVNIIPPWMNNMPVGVRSSEILSHHIDMKYYLSVSLELATPQTILDDNLPAINSS
jgi:hypothetical protein